MDTIRIEDLNQDTIPSLIDELILHNYIYNRQYRPDIAADKWSLVYGRDVYLYEIEYQKRKQKWQN